MKYYWNNGFYIDEINFKKAAPGVDPETGETIPPAEEYVIPEGCVEITVELYRSLLAGHAAGKRIVTGADGLPELADPPEKTLDELKAQAVNRLWSNYKTHQQKYVDPEDLTLAVVCASQGSAKGAAVQAWVLALWAEYYQVKDAVEAATTAEALAAITLTPDAENVPPYTIRELNEEAAAATAQE